MICPGIPWRSRVLIDYSPWTICLQLCITEHKWNTIHHNLDVLDFSSLTTEWALRRCHNMAWRMILQEQKQCHRSPDSPLKGFTLRNNAWYMIPGGPSYSARNRTKHFLGRVSITAYYGSNLFRWPNNAVLLAPITPLEFWGFVKKYSDSSVYQSENIREKTLVPCTTWETESLSHKLMDECWYDKMDTWCHRREWFQ